jgi:hypothetical protein
MASTFYRYRDEDGGWVVTDRLEAVPAAARDGAQRIEIAALPELAPAPPPVKDTGGAGVRPGAEGAEGPGVQAWVQKARQSVEVPAAPRLDFDGASFGLGLGLGLAAFVVYGFLRRSGRLVVRLALLGLVLVLLGTSVAGLWIAPHVPGAPDWLMTPDQLIREARRVAKDAAPEQRLGDLE